MTSPNHVPQPRRPSASFVALCLLLTGLLLAGGGSRADLYGQVLVRVIAFGVLVFAMLVDGREGPGRSVVLPAILIGALVLVLAQLVPLPPAIWSALPGRSLLERAVIGAQAQPWRPLTMVPGATFNAAASLVVPFATLFVFNKLSDRERDRLPGLILAVICLQSLVGLMQFAGAGPNNPFVNDSVGQVSGMFANRNHFALLLAIGCLLAPVWGFIEPRQSSWRVPLSIALVALFVLVLLASGSRAGLGLATLALVLATALTWSQARQMLRRFPRWAMPAAAGGIVVLIALPILLSVAAGRAVSIARLIELDPGQDMRQRALPTVLAMIKDYLPWGTGVGSFDPVFRIHEPDALLKHSYFNHAHNDFLETVLDAGIPGAILLAAALGWGTWTSVAVWRRVGERHLALGRLGSGILLLVGVASVFDYPARTPIMMAVMVVAALWLSNAADQGTALRERALHL